MSCGEGVKYSIYTYNILHAMQIWVVQNSRMRKK